MDIACNAAQLQTVWNNKQQPYILYMLNPGVVPAEIFSMVMLDGIEQLKYFPQKADGTYILESTVLAVIGVKGILVTAIG